MSVPPTSLTHSPHISIDLGLDIQGTLRTPSGPRQVSRQDPRQMSQIVTNCLLRCSLASLGAAGAFAGYAVYSGSETAMYCSAPFIAIYVPCLFGFIAGKEIEKMCR